MLLLLLLLALLPTAVVAAASAMMCLLCSEASAANAVEVLLLLFVLRMTSRSLPALKGLWLSWCPGLAGLVLAPHSCVSGSHCGRRRWRGDSHWGPSPCIGAPMPIGPCPPIVPPLPPILPPLAHRCTEQGRAHNQQQECTTSDESQYWYHSGQC